MLLGALLLGALLLGVLVLGALLLGALLLGVLVLGALLCVLASTVPLQNAFEPVKTSRRIRTRPSAPAPKRGSLVGRPSECRSTEAY